MRIVILTADASWGGAELHTVALARTLVERGHRVTILQLGHDNYARTDLGAAGIVLARAELSGPLPEIGWRECRTLAQRVDGDLCIFPKGFFSAGSWLLELAARLSYPRFVTIEHLCADPMPPRTVRRHFGGLLPGLGLWWCRLLFQRLMRSVGPAAVFGVSGAVLKKLSELYMFPGNKLKLVHNGIDPVKFVRNHRWRSSLRSAWGIPDSALVFGALGRFYPQKGYDTALQLFQRLCGMMKERDLRLVLAGEGPELAPLRARALESGVSERIVFAGYSDRPWEYYSAFDVFLMPSRNEGLPLALLEAMAAGCCPIATSVGGIPEILTNDRLGWLVSAGDEHAFLNAMEQAAGLDAGLLSEIGGRARSHVVAHFNAAVQFQELARQIEDEAG